LLKTLHTRTTTKQHLVDPAKIPSLGNGIEIGLNAYVGPHNAGKIPPINHQKDSSYSTSIL
jgi:hypothetical protein